MKGKWNQIWQKWAWLIIVAFVVLSVMLGLGTAMRESDQASILTGSLDLAWGGDIVKNDAYRYEKFYGTYWMLAIVFKMARIAVGEDPQRVVWLGNLVSALGYVFAVVCLLWRRPMSPVISMVVFIALSSPVLLLSAVFVSPNVFSVMWLLLLLKLWSIPRKSVSVSIGLLFCSFMAVACRVDALLVLPIVCLLAERGNVLQCWKRPRSVVVGSAAIAALMLGILVGKDGVAVLGEVFFFDPKVAAAYLLFGGGAALCLLILVALGWVMTTKKSYLWLAAMALLPLLFYLGLLYSPRHLIGVPVVLVATAVLPRGRSLWAWWAKRPMGRVALSLTMLLSLGLLTVGVRMPRYPSFSLVLSGQMTLYPSSDGYWPMGSTLAFLNQLRQATDSPVDHNQQVWAAWRNFEFAEGQRVHWDRLYRYPELVAKLQGKSMLLVRDTEHAVFSERAWRREDVVLPMGAQAVMVSDRVPRCWIMRQVPSGEMAREAEVRWHATEALRGRDFLIFDGLWSEQVFSPENYLGHRVFVISRQPEVQGLDSSHYGSGLFVHSGILAGDQGMWQNTWVAVTRLPAYMEREER